MTSLNGVMCFVGDAWGTFSSLFRCKKRSQSGLMGMQGRNAEPGQWLVSCLSYAYSPNMSPRSALTTDTSCYVRLLTLVDRKHVSYIILSVPLGQIAQNYLYV